MSDLYEEGRRFFDLEEYEKALEIYSKGDSEGDLYCSFGLAQLLINGWGIEKDEERANKVFARIFSMLKNEAENNRELAQCMIGVAYGNGYYVQKDIVEAKLWYRKAAKKTNVFAIWNLFIIYANGYGVKKSNKNAAVWLVKAAEMEYAKAQEQLAMWFKNGVGVEKSIEKAIYWYNKAIEQGRIVSMVRLADIYYDGIDIEQDYTKAFTLYIKAANKGNRDAEFRVGVMYDNGYGVVLDKEKAIYWFERAAKQGVSEAQFNLGLMYKRGDGIEINLEKSAEWMLLSAKQENRDSQWLMGDKYIKGEGVEKSIEEAIYWLEKAALNGRGEAAYEVGHIYEENTEKEGNIDKAIYWFEKGFNAIVPDENCAWRLGRIYEEDAKLHSLKKAKYWYKKGAKKGCVYSQDRLGDFYRCGIGVKKNTEKAFYWYTHALKRYLEEVEVGNVDAIEKIAEYKINGYGCCIDIEEGNVWYRKYFNEIMPDAEAGDRKKQCEVADAYMNGKGVEKSYIKAEYWYKKSADQGLERAKKRLAKIYCKGLLGKVDGEKAITLYEEVRDYCEIGKIYESGVGVEVDLNKAEYWYKKGCQNKESIAFIDLALFYYKHKKNEKGQEIIENLSKIASDADWGSIGYWILGDCYKEGIGVEKNQEKSVELYRKSFTMAKEQGDDLCNYYYHGIGTRKNYKKALKLCLLNSEYVLAQEMLGDAYANGRGVKKNFKDAIYWYEKSAQQGNINAIFALAEFYYLGRGCEQDYGKAIDYFKQANQIKGDAAPYYYLGDCYHHGLGVKPDWHKAKKYYEKAIELGYNCEYALDMVKIDLGEYRKVAEMEKYAKSLNKLNLSGELLKTRINNDLEKDFGESWAHLKNNAKIGLTTGVLTYVTFISMGEEFCKQLDFSAVIVNFAKALEVELAEYFYKGYIRFLKKKNVSPTVFSEDACFLNVHKEKGIETSREYQDENLIKNFKLGGLKFIIDDKFETMPSIEIAMYSKSMLNGRSETYRKFKNFKGEAGIRTIDKHMLAYANELFSTEAFTAANRKKEIVNYLIDLANAVGEIAYQYRNPAAHGDVMVKDKASACGDYLIKVRKLIYGFLSKIKKKYRDGFIEWVATKEKN